MPRSLSAFAMAMWVSARCAQCARVQMQREFGQISRPIMQSEHPQAKKPKTGEAPQDLEPLSPGDVAEISPDEAGALEKVSHNLDGIQAEFSEDMSPDPEVPTTPGASSEAAVCVEGHCMSYLGKALTALAMRRAFFADVISARGQELEEQHASPNSKNISQKCSNIVKKLIAGGRQDCAEQVRNVMKAFAELRERIVGTDDEHARQQKFRKVDELRNNISIAFDTEIRLVLSQIGGVLSPAPVGKSYPLPGNEEDMDDADIDPLPLGSAGMSDDDATELAKIFERPVRQKIDKRQQLRLTALKRWEAFMNKVLTQDVGELWNAHVSQGTHGVSGVSVRNKLAIERQFSNKPKERQLLRLTMSLFASACALVDDETRYRRQRHSKVLGEVFQLLEKTRSEVTAIYKTEIEKVAGGS